jgi:hypothetical protein
MPGRLINQQAAQARRDPVLLVRIVACSSGNVCLPARRHKSDFFHFVPGSSHSPQVPKLEPDRAPPKRYIYSDAAAGSQPMFKTREWTVKHASEASGLCRVVEIYPFFSGSGAAGLSSPPKPVVIRPFLAR